MQIFFLKFQNRFWGNSLIRIFKNLIYYRRNYILKTYYYYLKKKILFTFNGIINIFRKKILYKSQLGKMKRNFLN